MGPGQRSRLEILTRSLQITFRVFFVFWIEGQVHYNLRFIDFQWFFTIMVFFTKWVQNRDLGLKFWPGRSKSHPASFSCFENQGICLTNLNNVINTYMKHIFSLSFDDFHWLWLIFIDFPLIVVDFRLFSSILYCFRSSEASFDIRDLFSGANPSLRTNLWCRFAAKFNTIYFFYGLTSRRP